MAKCRYCPHEVRDKLKSGKPRLARNIVAELRAHVRNAHPEAQIDKPLNQALGDMRYKERVARNVGVPNSCDLCGDFNGHFGRACPRAAVRMR